MPTPVVLGGGTGEIVYSHSIQNAQSTELRMVNVETNEDVVLLSPKGGEHFQYPRWSPDGKIIALHHGLCGISHNLALFDIEQNVLTFESSVQDSNLDWGSWSPAQDKLIFSMRGFGHIHLFVLDLVADHPTRITNDPTSHNRPDWHPEEDEIVFVQYFGSNAEICTINIDGTGFKRLTDHPSVDTNPCWSPDGLEIMFESNRERNDEIYIMNRDGTEVRNISQNPADDKDPAWSPDGKWIAFTSDRAPNDVYSIYIMGTDGSDVRYITEGHYPDWRPLLDE
jgi:TolB protein